MHWGWKVAAYLVTKGIAAGAALWAPFLLLLGSAAGPARDYAPELIALVFLGATNLLLVADLKRPQKFLSILLRPNQKSWLVKGAYVLIAFSTIAGAGLVARFFGLTAVADGLRWLGLCGGAMGAGYTAFLFAQCEGRDLWQNTRVLLPHLLVQAACVGGFALLPFVPHPALATGIALAALANHALGFCERFQHHHTHNARLAAVLLPTVPAWPGSRLSAFHVGLASTTTAGLLAFLLVQCGIAEPALLARCRGRQP